MGFSKEVMDDIRGNAYRAARVAREHRMMREFVGTRHRVLNKVCALSRNMVLNSIS